MQVLIAYFNYPQKKICRANPNEIHPKYLFCPLLRQKIKSPPLFYFITCKRLNVKQREWIAALTLAMTYSSVITDLTRNPRLLYHCITLCHCKTSSSVIARSETTKQSRGIDNIDKIKTVSIFVFT
jgi:hypothetical protein